MNSPLLYHMCAYIHVIQCVQSYSLYIVNNSKIIGNDLYKQGLVQQMMLHMHIEILCYCKKYEDAFHL
jgi:hypothetical protein